MDNNPYEILGVSEFDSLEHIESVYKKYLLLLHADKAHTQEAKNLSMGQEEKNQYLQLIRGAYTRIVSSRKETKYPDYKIDYTIDQDTRINIDKSFLEELDDGEGFNEKFNRKFKEGLERDKKAGVVDAFGRGYGEFDFGKKFSDEGKITMPTYNREIDVESSKIFHRPDMKDNRLVEYLPESSFGTTGMDYQELGLTNVSDFSMTTSGKGALGGTDLMSVYGNNYEPWEKTIMRDPKLSAKFIDETNVSQRMAQMEEDRGNIYDLPIDQNIMEAERTRNFAMEQQEKIRMANKNFRDEYYNELNKGRLTDRGNQIMNQNKSTRNKQPQLPPPQHPRQLPPLQSQSQPMQPLMMTKKIQSVDRGPWPGPNMAPNMAPQGRILSMSQMGQVNSQMAQMNIGQRVQPVRQQPNSNSNSNINKQNRQSLESWGQ